MVRLAAPTLSCAAFRVALALAAMTLASCGPEPTAAPRSTALADAERAYQAGAWLKAYDEGCAAQAISGGDEAARAAVIAGSAAARLGELQRAEDLLSDAATSANGRIRAEALVTRASVRASLGLDASAAADLEDALPLLDAQDARRARQELQHLRPAVASATPTPRPPAAAAVPPAASNAAAQAARATAAPRVESTGRWLLQAGSFSKRATAARRAAELASDCQRVKLGEPVIEEVIAPNGGTLYRVVLGVFTERSNADSARRELGRTDIIVQAEVD